MMIRSRTRTRLISGWFFACLAAVIAPISSAAGTGDGSAARLRPRAPLSKAEAPHVRPNVPFESRLVVKFHDDVRARAVGGGLVSETDVNLAGLTALANQADISFSQLIRLPDEKIDLLEERAANNSGVAQPDLAGMMIVRGPDNASVDQIAAALHASDLVEFVYFEVLAPPPPCEDLSPVSLHFVNEQLYRGGDPGLNMDAAQLFGGARGFGVQVADCEYDVIDDHEDLCGITYESGQTGYLFEEHGTAVFGELISIHNDYGCSGLVPEATPYFFTEYSLEEGSRRPTSIANAIATVNPGDVVLLEMQQFGPDFRYCPAEIDPAVWTIVKNGTDGGVIVVAAAGNGEANLDSATYSEYRSRGDSGAIIVGAGTPNTRHDRLSFSTYGARVNVQGWGQSVFTLGYGDAGFFGGDVRQTYTATFSGTSSASPFVTSACIALQSMAQNHLGVQLSPIEMRDLLIATGVPQGSGGNIGPFPDVAAAAEALLGGNAMALTAGPLIAGEMGEFTVSNASPGATVYIIYSLDGVGATPVPQLDVVADLLAPSLGGSTVANANGQAIMRRTIPLAGQGREIHLQALERGRVSTVEIASIN